MKGFVLKRIENTVEKEENAAKQHFSFSHNVFKSSQGSLISGLCSKGLTFSKALFTKI